MGWNITIGVTSSAVILQFEDDGEGAACGDFKVSFSPAEADDIGHNLQVAAREVEPVKRCKASKGDKALRYRKDQAPAGVVAWDPPWQFGDALGKRGAEAKYPTMSLEELVALELPPMLPDCVLFTWRVASMPGEALELIKAHGFTYKTELVWIKKTVKGKRHFGMGRTLRGEHETCLIATRGKPKVLNKSTRSTFEAKVGRHSAKPPEFFAIAEKLYKGPYVELFARERREGWDCYGNELKCQTCDGTGFA